MTPEEARIELDSILDGLTDIVGENWEVLDGLGPTPCVAAGGVPGLMWLGDRVGDIDLPPQEAADRAKAYLDGLGFETRYRTSGGVAVEAIGERPLGLGVQFGSGSGRAGILATSACVPDPDPEE